MVLFNPTQATIILILGIALMLSSLILIFIREQRPLLKLVWALIVLGIPLLGASVYLLKVGVEWLSGRSLKSA